MNENFQNFRLIERIMFLLSNLTRGNLDSFQAEVFFKINLF